MTEPVAYEFEVKGPFNDDFTRRVEFDDPREKWRDDHELRNVKPLYYKDD